jgi:hypothetical protein
MKQAQVKELLVQSLEHERGDVEVYTMAGKCTLNEDLKKERDQALDGAAQGGAGPSDHPGQDNNIGGFSAVRSGAFGGRRLD